MTRYKAELKKVHRAKVRKAKGQLRRLAKGEVTANELTQRAKRLLKKTRKKESIGL